MAEGGLREIFASFEIEVDEKPLKDLEAAVTAAKAGLLGLTGTLGETALGLYEVVEKTAEAGDQALKMAQRVGIGVEAFQRLAFAAKMADIDQAELGHSLSYLNRRMFEATHGSGEAQKSFNDLFGGFKDLRGLGAEQVLGMIADRFKQLGDKAGPQKAAAAMGVFSRQGIAMIPWLNKGSAEMRRLGETAEALGGVFTKEGAEAAEHFKDSMKLLAGTFEGIRRQVGMQFMPIFQNLVDKFQDFIFVNRDLIKQNLSGFVAGLTRYLRLLYSIAKPVISSIEAYARAFGGAAKGVERFTFYLTAMVGLLSGALLLAAIGKLATVFGSVLVGALRAAGNEALFTQAKLIAMPILIGAALLALGLILEDLYQYFHGGDSVFGYLEQQFVQFVDTLEERFPTVKTILDALGSAAKAASYIASGGFMDGTGAANKGQSSWLTSPTQAIHDALLGPSQTSASPSIAGAAAATSGGRGMLLNQDINVNVPPGTSPDDVPDFIRRGVVDPLNEIFRQTGRATAAGHD